MHQKNNMKILLVYPNYPETFWSFKHALKFIGKKATHPPLGLLTVGALLSQEWEKRLVDMNVTTLRDTDIEWADYVFISAMSIQTASVKSVIERCKRLGVKIVAGGPLFTTGYEEFEGVDHFVLNEAEITLPLFLEDLQNGCARHLYTSQTLSDIDKTPIPLWELIDMKKYAIMSLQYSRGCPYHCEFCDIPYLYGNKVRIKSKDRIIAELESLHAHGWRGEVFFVDDNFIGNMRKLKREFLPALTEWMERKRYPFVFNTEASIDLADDEELMQLMVQAGFTGVFVGIETPNEASLAECNKVQNKNRDLIASVKKIQEFGLNVTAGFIIGFDNDPPSIFERLSAFIQDSGIVSAMVGLLNAPRGSKLYERLLKEGRIVQDVTGDNTDFTINFIPRMDYETLIRGYGRVIKGIYSSEPYYRRIKLFLRDFKYMQKKTFQFHFYYIGAFFKTILFLGIIDEERMYYWKIFFWSLFKRTQLFPWALVFTVYGYQYRKVFEKYL
jgi:radical SAM superfamily enzyme YgiQ (UPF0313 family)